VIRYIVTLGSRQPAREQAWKMGMGAQFYQTKPPPMVSQISGFQISNCPGRERIVPEGRSQTAAPAERTQPDLRSLCLLLFKRPPGNRYTVPKVLPRQRRWP